jgi:predicted dehydrogenase
MNKVRMAVVGIGAFGKNHLRVLSKSPRVELVAAVDIDAARRAEAGCDVLADYRELVGRIDAAVVAVPTTLHAEVGCTLLEAGIDVLLEKPIASTLADGARLRDTAKQTGRILQVGHLERFNPAVIALEKHVRLPLFFEIHRMSVFTPRSLDVDVVLDLMIHDLDLVLHLTGMEPEEVRAAGISILSGKVDIANVRLAFPGGCIANLTASRMSTEKVRKLRLFQPGQYISIDYARQDGVVINVSDGLQIGFAALPVQKDEPLRLQLEAFLDSVITRNEPRVNGDAAFRTLHTAQCILDKIEEHSQLVAQSIAASNRPGQMDVF